MDPTHKFRISKDELFCLAAICGYENVISITYPADQTREDLSARFRDIGVELRKKKWVTEDFDGNITVDSSMRTAMKLVCTAKQFWIIQVNARERSRRDFSANIYTDGVCALLFEQEDGENYHGSLYGGLSFCHEYVCSAFHFSLETEPTQKLAVNEAAQLAKESPYLLLNICRYFHDEGLVLCQDSALYISLGKKGEYTLQADEDDSNFVPLSRAALAEQSVKMFEMEAAKA